MGEQQFVFRELNSSNSLRKLARAAGLRFSGNTIQGMNGVALRYFDIEPGLNLRIWNFTPANELHLLKEPAGLKKTSHHLFFTISPKVFPASSLFVNYPDSTVTHTNTVLISATAPFRFKVLPGDHLKAIDISFDQTWLRNAFREPGPGQNSIVDEILKSNGTIRFSSYDFDLFKVLLDLHKAVEDPVLNFIRLRADVLRLISDYFQRCFSAVAQQPVVSQPFYYNRILQVEKLLKEHVCGSLPTLHTIAHSVALSESTLKRQFKQFHGTGIYDYYLKLKMQYAIQLLKDDRHSVNEVASLLDYEKVSCFIGMFKKHFGISPGIFRKQKGISAVA